LVSGFLFPRFGAGFLSFTLFCYFLFKHDLVRKPVPTFRDHAL